MLNARKAAENHPLFGEPGKRAPCRALTVAKDIGASERVVQRHRKRMGVLPYVKTQPKTSAELGECIEQHPGFGVPGEEAPCAATDIAAEVGCDPSTVQRRRREKGVLPFRHYTAAPPPADGKRRLTWSERQMYKLCGTTRSWGRPNGIDAHLAEIGK